MAEAPKPPSSTTPPPSSSPGSSSSKENPDRSIPFNPANEEDLEETSPRGVSTSGATGSKAPTQSSSEKQYIRASQQDNALEPDSMRGSEHLLKDLDMEDDEAKRREKISPKDSDKDRK
jgi:hypothetical protein